MTNEELMRLAIKLAIENIDNCGGPFGAVIARNGEIIATGTNRVTANNDPTAHAEVSAIRAAGQKLGTFDLSGCDIYSSCEPCPMCLSAIYWAHIDRLYYAATKTDAADAGFDDDFIYKELSLNPSQRRLYTERFMGADSLAVFEKWKNCDGKVEY